MDRQIFLNYQTLAKHENYINCAVFFLDHYAVRRKIGGSYMLRLLSESVGGSYTKSGSANLMDMLRDVMYQMSEMTFHGSKEYKTVPCIVHKLRKDVIFTHGRNMVETRPHMGGGCCACAIM